MKISTRRAWKFASRDLLVGNEASRLPGYTGEPLDFSFNRVYSVIRIGR